MEDYINLTKKLYKQGNTWAIYVKTDAEQLGYSLGDDFDFVAVRKGMHEQVRSILK